MTVVVFSILCVVWGLSWVAIKLSLTGFPPFLGAGLRFLVALPCLGGYAWYRGVPILAPRGTWPMITLTAILTYWFDYGLIYWGEQYLTAGVTAIFFGTFPIFTALASRFLFKSERVGIGTFGGLGVGFFGVFVTFSVELERSASQTMVVWAMLAIIGAAVAAAVATVLVKKNLTQVGSVTLSLNQLLVGTVGLVILSLLAREEGQAGVNVPAMVGVLYLAVVCTALAFTLYYWLLKRVSAVSLSTMIYITPVVAVVSDWLLLDGVITLKMLAGMLLIFLGIALSEFPKYRSYFRKRAPL